ncbi:MAG: hypothetical protein HN370_08860 [Phycisphaerales bacterium]|jgi:hypothetical protein|nr:hypothetical protein [Phycisphaerales bacterium]
MRWKEAGGNLVITKSGKAFLKLKLNGAGELVSADEEDGPVAKRAKTKN